MLRLFVNSIMRFDIFLLNKVNIYIVFDLKKTRSDMPIMSSYVLINTCTLNKYKR